MTYTEIVAWIQIFTGLATAGAIIFYAGKVTQKLKDQGDQIVELKSSDKKQWDKIAEHSEKIAVLKGFLPTHIRE